MNEIQEIKNNHNVTALFKLPKAEEVESIIDNNLRHDWIVRIEYTDSVVMHNTRWQQWGETRFAIKSTENIMRDIYQCRARFSKHSIRLSAEKMRPQTKLIYSIYCPEREMEDDMHSPVNGESQTAVSAGDSVMPGKWMLTRQMNSLAGKARVSVWRIFAIMSMFIASLLLIQEVVIH